jgi:hypothetical protein
MTSSRGGHHECSQTIQYCHNLQWIFTAIHASNSSDSKSGNTMLQALEDSISKSPDYSKRGQPDSPLQQLRPTASYSKASSFVAGNFVIMEEMPKWHFLPDFIFCGKNSANKIRRRENFVLFIGHTPHSALRAKRGVTA